MPELITIPPNTTVRGEYLSMTLGIKPILPVGRYEITVRDDAAPHLREHVELVLLNKRGRPTQHRYRVARADLPK